MSASSGPDRTGDGSRPERGGEGSDLEVHQGAGTRPAEHPAVGIQPIVALLVLEAIVLLAGLAIGVGATLAVVLP